MSGYEPGGGGGAPASQVSWNPGAPASNDYASTWADVMTAFGDAAEGDFLVSLDTSGGGAFAIPVGNYDLEKRVRFGQPAPATNQAVVVLADGAVLTNPAGLHRNVTLQGNGSVAASVLFTDGHAMEVDLGSIVENAGAAPMIDVPAGATCALYLNRYSRVIPTASEVVTIGVGSTLSASFQTDSQSLDDWATGDPAGTLAISYDATYDATTLSAAPGTVTEDATATITALREALWYSPVDYIATGLAPGVNAGSQSSGIIFYAMANITIVGVRFHWGDAVARTIKCKVYTAGALQQSVNVAVNGIGAYTGTFPAPVVCGPLATPNYHSLAIWETAGAVYQNYAGYVAMPTANAGARNTLAFHISQHMVVRESFQNYNAGDTNLANSANWTMFPVEPIFG